MKLKILFAGKAKNTKIQLFRSVFTSQISFQVDLLLYYGLINFLSVHYLVSSATGFMIGTTMNYFLSIIWVFPDRRMNNRKWEYTSFIFTGIAGAGINLFFLWVFIDIIGIHYMISKIAVAAVVFFVTFTMRKVFIFSTKRTMESELAE